MELKCFSLSRQDARVYRRINHVDGQRSLHTRTTLKPEKERQRKKKKKKKYRTETDRERERERERLGKQTSKLQSEEDSKGPCVALGPGRHSGEKGERSLFRLGGLLVSGKEWANIVQLRLSRQALRTDQSLIRHKPS